MTYLTLKLSEKQITFNYRKNGHCGHCARGIPTIFVSFESLDHKLSLYIYIFVVQAKS